MVAATAGEDGPGTPSLFNAADDIIADLVGLKVFEESLLLNVLFQERVLIHEAFLFNSTLLAAHLSRAGDRLSLFEQAARRGKIVPAYRLQGCLTVDDAYEAMLKEYGQTYRLLHPRMKPFQGRVSTAVDAGVKAGNAPFYWASSNLGEGYLKVLRRMLQAGVPPVHTFSNPDRRLHFAVLWEGTKDWRKDLIEIAAERTKARGGGGVQRTEIFRLLGESVGITYSEASAPSVADLVQRSTGDQEKLAISVFAKWVSQCHHLNQAQSFGTAMNFPAYDLDEDFMMDSLLR